MFPPSFCIVILYFLLQLISQSRFIIFTNFLCLLQSLTVNNLYLGSGVDNTGVPTKMVTMNCSLKISVYNPATLFGILVSSSPINLMYSKISMANGQVNFHVPLLLYRKGNFSESNQSIPNSIFPKFGLWTFYTSVGLSRLSLHGI